MGKTKTLPKSPGKYTFEDVWAALMEGREQQKENDKKIKELIKESKETDRQMKETDRRISRLGNRIGELIEHFAAPNLIEKFDELGFEFNTISRNHIIKNKRKEDLAEIDILLEDGEYVMVIEVKSLLNKNDVIEHQERMKIIREYADKRNDKRKYIAAVAAATTGNEAKEYALANGIYVIEQTGDNIRIKAPSSMACW